MCGTVFSETYNEITWEKYEHILSLRDAEPSETECISPRISRCAKGKPNNVRKILEESSSIDNSCSTVKSPQQFIFEEIVEHDEELKDDESFERMKLVHSPFHVECAQSFAVSETEHQIDLQRPLFEPNKNDEESKVIITNMGMVQHALKSPKQMFRKKPIKEHNTLALHASDQSKHKSRRPNLESNRKGMKQTVIRSLTIPTQGKKIVGGKLKLVNTLRMDGRKKLFSGKLFTGLMHTSASGNDSLLGDNTCDLIFNKTNVES